MPLENNLGLVHVEERLGLTYAASLDLSLMGKMHAAELLRFVAGITVCGTRWRRGDRDGLADGG